MTPEELQQLQNDYMQICHNMRMRMHFANLPIPRMPMAHPTPQEMVEHINYLEPVVCRAINIWLRKLDFNRSLAEQKILMVLVLDLDLSLQQLHRVLARHIHLSWITDSTDNQHLITTFVRLATYTSPAGTTNNVMDIPFQQIVLLHYYRAWLANGLQRGLVERLSIGMDARKKYLEFLIMYFPMPGSLVTDALQYDDAMAQIPEENVTSRFEGKHQCHELNVTLSNLNMRISPEDIDRFSNIIANPRGSNARISCYILSETNESFYDKTPSLDASLMRLLSGAIFIGYDRQPGYYGFHILLMHELAHVLNIIEGTVISTDTCPGLFGIDNKAIGNKWGLAGEMSNPIEEFRATFLDDFSEYKLVKEMGLNPRMPYECYMLPLALARMYPLNQWDRVSEMQGPVESHLQQHEGLRVTQGMTRY